MKYIYYNKRQNLKRIAAQQNMISNLSTKPVQTKSELYYFKAIPLWTENFKMILKKF